MLSSFGGSREGLDGCQHKYMGPGLICMHNYAKVELSTSETSGVRANALKTRSAIVIYAFVSVYAADAIESQSVSELW